MHYPKEVIEQINNISKLSDVASDFMKLKKSGKDQLGKCPSCGKEGKNKGMTINDGKDVFKCFHCETSGKGAINFLMTTQNFTFQDAIEYLAKKYSVEVESEEERQKRLKYEGQKKKNSKKAESFRDRQLRESGLTNDDVRAQVNDEDGTQREVTPFMEGTVDQYYKLKMKQGDDMVIFYYDLDGMPIMYTPKKRNHEEHFYRVRFQNPEERKDKNGRPIKYYSPSGSGTHLYIPQKIRGMYKQSRKIKRLFIQEGEKKAEKSCKHGVLSVGVMGIHNIGSYNTMPKELQLIIQKCEVEEIIFMLDADWQDLSSNLKVYDNVQQRPLSFFYAIKNYKEYMLSLRNLGINLEICFGAVRDNEQNDKGIDDLLANSLQGQEDKLQEDIDHTMNEKGEIGEYVEIHKITSLTDYQIKNFWELNNNQEFAQKHLDVLRNIPEFYIYKTKFKINENDELQIAEPILPEEKYWSEDEKGKLSFNYARCYTFLRNRGFGRLRMTDKWRYVKYENHIVRAVDQGEIKDFVTETTEQIASENVLNLLYQGGHFYLGEHSLSNLKFFDIDFEKPSRYRENMHFLNKFWKIDKNGIQQMDPTDRLQSIWHDQIIKFDAKLTKEPLIKFKKIDEDFISQFPETQQSNLKHIKGFFDAEISEEGKQCHFLQFLQNTSNFHAPKTKKQSKEYTIDEMADINTHLLSKLTALGYMVHSYRDPAVAKAIIAMDGQLAEVGDSNGRSGKSLLGSAMEWIIPTVYIGAKAKKLTDDQFLFEEVTEKTECVFLDDVRANLDFEFFFPAITGKMKVNAKGVGRWTIPREKTPKFFISTNHAINGDSSSFRDRQFCIAFSDYYNDNHKPVDDFGVLFFEEWDEKQWNLFYNLVATSLQLYFKYGLVEAPGRDLELRRLRQQMGEDFLTWAEEYYSKDTTGREDEDQPFDNDGNLDKRIPRQDLYSDFINKHPRASRFVSPTRFGKSVKWFCRYKGYHFNPDRPNKKGQNFADFLRENPKSSFIGSADKAGGVEYFTVSAGDTEPEDDNEL